MQLILQYDLCMGSFLPHYALLGWCDLYSGATIVWKIHS